MNFSLFSRKDEVVREKLWALRSKLPATLDVSVSSSENGGYVARVKNLPGCFTEGDSFQELNDMINAAVYDYFEVPEAYVPYVQSYGPPREMIERMEARGETFVDSAKHNLVFQRV